jgi:hypothetical protein
MGNDVPDGVVRPSESGMAGDNPLRALTPGGQRPDGQSPDEPFGPRGSESGRYNVNDSHDLDPETMGQGVVEDAFEKTARAPVPVLGNSDQKPR